MKALFRLCRSWVEENAPMQRPDVLHTFGHVHRGCKKFRSVTHHGVLIKFSVLTSKKLACWHQQSRTLRRQKCCRRSFFLSIFARLAPLASWSAIRSLWTFRHCPEAHQSTADTASTADTIHFKITCRSTVNIPRRKLAGNFYR